MTKEEAVALSRREGVKIKHRYFSDNEFILVQGAMVFLTEGYKTDINDFFSYRRDESWNTGWSLFKG